MAEQPKPSAQQRQFSSTRAGLRMAYLLSIYPGVSHTFFLNEITGLRNLGFEIETASINPPDLPYEQLDSAAAAEARSTYCIKHTGKARALGILVSTLFTHPIVFFRGLRAAMGLGGWDPYLKLYSLLYLAEALLTGHWMKKHGLRHLHIHFGGPVATVGLLTAETWDFTYSLTVHGPDEFYDVQASILPLKIARASFIVCISNFCRSQVMKYSAPSQWSKMHVVHLGVNLDRFTPMRPRENPVPLHILCVGRLVPSKGQHILLQAVSDLLDKGHTLHLTFVGNGPDRPSLEQFVAARQIGESITFCGALNHDQTRDQFSQADIFVLASFAEGVPIALMEAMAMEIPCISTRIAGIPELIRDNIDGLLISPASVESLSASIEKLALDPALRRRLGVSGRARVADRFNLPVNLERLASVFEENLPHA